MGANGETTHVDVAELAAHNAAAIRHWVADRPADAVPLFAWTLAGCRAQLGDDHPDTLTVAGNLGVALVASGRWEDGLDLLGEVLADRVRMFGEDDPRTLTAGEALACAYRLTGDRHEAGRLSAEVVASRVRVLGRAHPDTIVSRLNAGLTLLESDRTADHDAAAALLGEALADAERALGSRHPRTIAVRAAVARARAAAVSERWRPCTWAGPSPTPRRCAAPVIPRPSPCARDLVAMNEACSA